ncbi:hypothetical protein BO94DRAFT_605254 [Aspergillus sclerotioniger CBS 115572]|uniref:Protein kinase domain-containing protein n=1 Tax=Aspergillus sclerotioniger CBS 115572 TaxID=1450535 RepID=A0A317VNY3_9EURO|nr:hypothetical protein BO94DRAFT_605254 [Aspergillus sclerotioniger CBS 115572]PWY76046.1 hypothetical protein BO94DRAFT_605254 [Aspergillus sclerotioniger CBS 115572]
MTQDPEDALNISLDLLQIGKELKRSEASSIFEVEIEGTRYAMKVFHDNGDPGFTEKGRDLNRFRCELRAYRNLRRFGVCDRGSVPYYHGYFDQLDPAQLAPHLNHYMEDINNPSVILLEYLEGTEELNCVNYSDDSFQIALRGLQDIHSALVHHDIYPKNILIVRGPPERRETPERVVWIDFNVAMTFTDKQSISWKEEEYFNYEMKLAASFGDLLREDQKEGLPPNTKFY